MDFSIPNYFKHIRKYGIVFENIILVNMVIFCFENFGTLMYHSFRNLEFEIFKNEIGSFEI